jgi:hypothetical protein
MKLDKKGKIQFIKNKIETGELILGSNGLYRKRDGKRYASNSTGYIYVNFKIKGTVNTIQEHIALYCIYNNLEEIPQGLEVNHKNFDRTDNSPDNLELVTRSENMKYSHEAQRFPRYALKVTNAKLNARKVKEIRKLLEEGASYASIQKKYDIGSSQVYRIKSGEDWSWVK